MADDESATNVESPVAFLFDSARLAQARSFAYRRPALKATLASLLDADRDAAAAFELRQGDMLLHTLAYAITGVEAGKSTNSIGNTSYRSEGDTDLYVTLVWDFCDSLGERWHTLDLQQLSSLLLRLDVSAIVVSSLSADKRDATHTSLRHRNAYVGAFCPDRDNPIHRRIAWDGLIHACDYRNRSLLFDPWESEDPSDPPALERDGNDWFAGLDLRELRYKTEAELVEHDLVPRWTSSRRSARGERSAMILSSRARPNHLGRLASVAGRLAPADGAMPFSIRADAMRRAADAVVQPSKLIDYALNLDHAGGRDKARWFLAALGIGRDDWRHLAAQLKLGLAQAVSIEDVRATAYGVQYAVTTTVRGLNGASARVKSAWEVRDDTAPRLTTVHPAKREDDPTDAPPSLIVPASLTGQERWEALWEIAHGHASDAAGRAIPTPIMVSGEWWPDGAFGFAWVTVRGDARKGFARWLLRADHAYLERGKGAVVLAPGYLVDSARAHADAFAEVLALNGIDSAVGSRLD